MRFLPTAARSLRFSPTPIVHLATASNFLVWLFNGGEPSDWPVADPDRANLDSLGQRTPDLSQTVTLVCNEPSCRKCRDTQAVLEAVVAECPELCTVRYLMVPEAHEEGLGAVPTPMVLVDGQVLCAGIVPRQAGLLRLIRGN